MFNQKDKDVRNMNIYYLNYVKIMMRIIPDFE